MGGAAPPPRKLLEKLDQNFYCLILQQCLKHAVITRVMYRCNTDFR
jgi:predicted transcriptional regulator